MAYIDREAVIKEMSNRWNVADDQDFCNKEVWHVLEEFPAADVQPVKHGKWKKRYYLRPATGLYDVEMKVCTECEYEFSYDIETGIDEAKYCPNCGAKMDG